MHLNREDQALREVGHTQITRTSAWWSVITFLFTLGVVPLGQEFYQHVQQKESLPAKIENAFVIHPQGYPTSSELKSFENQINDDLWIRDFFLPRTQLLLCRLGTGNEQVYVGKQGWLFYRPAVDHLTGPGFLETNVQENETRNHNPLPAIIDFAEQLKGRGIELWILPIPSKASIYPEYLTGSLAGEPIQNASFSHFKKKVQEAGIHLIDPAPLLEAAKSQGQIYLKSDTHWTPRGIEVMAGHLAGNLVKKNIASTKSGAVAMLEQRKATGDIAAMLRLPASSRMFPEEKVETRKVRWTNGQETTAPILILGDSFSNIYEHEALGWGRHAGLASQLSLALATPVDAIAVNDGGAWRSRAELARLTQLGQDRLAHKKIVIWQFAARELSFGDWKHIKIPDPKKPTKEPSKETPPILEQEGPEHIPQTLTGLITQVASLPAPGSVPYRDAVTSILLTGVTYAGKAMPDQLVFLWGMKNNQITEGGKLKPGKKIQVEVVPWIAVAEQLGPYQRAEISDSRIDHLQPWWSPRFIEHPSNEDSWNQAPVLAPGSKDHHQSVAPESPMVQGAEAASPNLPREDSNAVKKDAGHLPSNSPLGAPPNQDLPDASPWPSWIEKHMSGTSMTLQGTEQWLFFLPELRHLSAGPFWGPATVTNGQAGDPQWADPLPAILDFHHQLEAQDIELILLPIPAKTAIYPEYLPAHAPPPNWPDHYADMVAKLKAEGIQVLDLQSLFFEAKAAGAPLYLKSDTHWSPRAVDLTAEAVAHGIKAKAWYTQTQRQEFIRQPQTIAIAGDLTPGQAGYDPEKVLLQVVKEAANQELVQPWRESPVLLIGDSHTLVFHAGGDLFARGAGLPDQLAFRIGFPADLIGVRGSGATAVRLSLLRRRDNLKGKKIVIWCFSARSFTESVEGWRKIPVIRTATTP